MANQIYGYSSSYGGSGGGYSMRASDPYLSAAGSSRYAAEADAAAKYAALDFGGDRVSSLYSSQRLASVDVAGKIGGGIGSAAPSLYSQSSWGGVDVDSGMKRSAEALYHHTILGSHNTTGQSEALFSTNSLVKRPRIDIASNLPVYPQRPGEKDCAHYMVTRTCRFGEACKFDHPIWVPEGGIPDWKEVPLMPISESLPERPGEADCPYFLKTQKCKFGFRCKFNHPKDTLTSSAGGSNGEGVEPASHAVLPDRPSEPICAFYAKTGKCKFGANCKFHHPKDIEIPSAGQDGGVEPADSTVKDNGAASGESVTAKSFVPFTPALLHNSKGLPIRPGETDCPFYLKTGSCKYGATCRYNHPDRNAINPTFIANLGHAIAPSPASSLQVGVVNPAASLFQSLDPLLAQTTLGVSPTVYPQRPGQIECDFYMKTGQCKFGERCKFHHPIDRLAPTLSAAKQAQVGVKLTLAGLPRREGSVACPFYMKTGTCKYGATCRFDHPPPGEAIAMATVQGTVNANAAGEAEKDVAATGENQL